jgi:hypothetical protein
MIVWWARIATVAALAAVLAFSIQSCRLSDRDAEIAVRSLERAGWTRGDQAKPVIPDLPKGVRPVAVISGGVRFAPVSPVKPAPGTSAPVTPSAAVGGGCDLNGLAVTIDCRAEVVSAAGGVPVARLFVRGLLEDGERRRELPWHRVGDPVAIPLPGGGEQPVDTKTPDVAIRLPGGRRWWVAVRAGVSSDAELVAGASLGRARWGAWADYRRAVGRQTVAGGVELRF